MRFILAFVLFFSVKIFAQEIQIPALNSPVMDTANILASDERESLSQLAYEINTNNGPQITIFTVPDLQGLEIEDFSMKVAEKWQLGTKKAGNGILVTIAMAEKKMRIEVGEGIEGEITDYDTAQYTRRVFPEYFREKRFYDGLRLFMVDVARRFNIKEESGDGFVRRAAPTRQGSPLGSALPFFAIALVASYLIARRKPFLRGILTGAGFGGISFVMLPAFGPLIIIILLGFFIGVIGVGNLLMGLASGSRYGGGGGFDGGGGSSWGGGGGGFSGGGSSGNW